MDLEPGTHVAQYVIEGILGRGGMASVYLVRHDALGSRFALKVLDLASEAIRARLKDEGRLQAALRHPNIVSVLDVVEVDGWPGLVLEYVDGPPLDKLLAAHRLTLDQIDEVARGILKGVRVAHRAGLVHRDLKPGNILMARTDDGFVPKIADFGLAKATRSDGDMSRTRTGAMMGTPAYMAPEQFRSAKDVDERADVYSLGVILYELCTGRRPYDSEDLFELIDQVRSARYPSAASLVPGLPARMDDAIVRAMAVDAADRFEDVDGLYDAWVGRADRPDDRTSSWDRNLLDQLSSSPPVALPLRGPLTTPMSMGASLATTDTPRRARSGWGRRLAPVVAVMGLALSMMLMITVGTTVGVVGMVATMPSSSPNAAAPPVSAVEGARSEPPPASPVPAAVPPPTEPMPADIPAEDPDVPRPSPRPPDVPRPRPSPAPSPAPAAAIGTVKVEGEAQSVVFVGTDGARHPPGALPVGRYTVRVTFSGHPEADADLTVEVAAGATLSVRCATGFFSCTLVK